MQNDGPESQTEEQATYASDVAFRVCGKKHYFASRTVRLPQKQNATHSQAVHIMYASKLASRLTLTHIHFSDSCIP